MGAARGAAVTQGDRTPWHDHHRDRCIPDGQLGVLGLVFVVLYLLVFFAGGAKGSFTDRLHPKLGLDLVGGTQATYIASVQGGQVPSKESMEQARASSRTA
jgi:preprotein translocase subunit SecD